MRWAHFIDTSIMDNLLNLPGKNERHQDARDELTRLVKRKDTLILPVATVIETGNHIAQLRVAQFTGDQRYQLAQKFAEFLRATAKGQAPWEFGPPFDAAMLEQIADLLPKMAAKQIGGGDTSIRAAFDRYVATTPNVSVRVWSYDSDLADGIYELPEIGKR
ncbi:MAG TPA: hypothetical protein VGK74_11970 [Symbiobacteriaceae bacterium]|jgi:predicted nucleic acid-binding protein